MSSRTALITGISGQDGAYLARLLLEKGYTVFGGYRRSASGDGWRLQQLGIDADVKRVPFELLEFSNVLRAIDQTQPDEIYNLAAQSFVGVSFEQPVYTSDVDAIGVTRLLEAIRTVDSGIRFYQASTSEMFGKVREVPQRESTPFHPRSPYGVAKAYAHWMTVNYRESYGLHASSGVLFNHESPLRGREFVTRKITTSLARIRRGEIDVLELGNMESKRDWGYAGDYVEGMWRMLQQGEGGDFVLATGEAHSVKEFVNRAADVAGFRLSWDGEGKATRAVDETSGKTIVRVNPSYYRPAEVDDLLGDATRAREILDWRPQVTFEQLVEMMMEADMAATSSGTPYI